MSDQTPDDVKSSTSPEPAFVRMTGEQMEVAVEDRLHGITAGASAVRERFGMRQLTWLVAGLLAALAVLTLMLGSSGNSGFEARRQSNLAKIAELDRQVKAASNPSKAPDAEHIKQVLTQLGDAGGDMAKQQNTYTVTTAGSSANVGIASAMASHLTEAAVGAKVPWFTVTGPKVTTAKSEYLWTFKAPVAYSADGTTGVWQCNRNGSGELLAWAQGVWDEDAQKFSSVTWGRTAAGDDYVKAASEGKN